MTIAVKGSRPKHFPECVFPDGMLVRLDRLAEGDTDRIAEIIVAAVCEKVEELEANKHESRKLHAGRGPVGKAAVAGIKDRNTNQVTAMPVRLPLGSQA